MTGKSVKGAPGENKGCHGQAPWPCRQTKRTASGAGSATPNRIGTDWADHQEV